MRITLCFSQHRALEEYKRDRSIYSNTLVLLYSSVLYKVYKGDAYIQIVPPFTHI